MDLHREVLPGVDELVKQREAGQGGGVLASEDVPRVYGKKLAQVGAREGSRGDHAGIVVAIGEFPGFAYVGDVGRAFAEHPVKSIAAPELGLEDGPELEGFAYDGG